MVVNASKKFAVRAADGLIALGEKAMAEGKNPSACISERTAVWPEALYLSAEEELNLRLTQRRQGGT